MKQLLKTQEKLKELEIMYQNQSIYVFLNVAKFAYFRIKNADVSRIQGMCHVIYTIFGSSLDKV